MTRMTTENVTTIARSTNILPEDNRVVFSKYDKAHLAKLESAVLANLPTQLDDFPQAIDAVRNEMSKLGIAMYVDSYWNMFNAIWDNLPLELKTQTETETDDQYSGSPVNEVDGNVQS